MARKRQATEASMRAVRARRKIRLAVSTERPRPGVHCSSTPVKKLAMSVPAISVIQKESERRAQEAARSGFAPGIRGSSSAARMPVPIHAMASQNQRWKSTRCS